MTSYILRIADTFKSHLYCFIAITRGLHLIVHVHVSYWRGTRSSLIAFQLSSFSTSSTGHCPTGFSRTMISTMMSMVLPAQQTQFWILCAGSSTVRERTSVSAMKRIYLLFDLCMIIRDESTFSIFRRAANLTVQATALIAPRMPVTLSLRARSTIRMNVTRAV